MAVEPIPCSPGGGGEPVEVTTCCAPSIASTALCRADGTTILAVVRSGCVECGQEAEDPAVVGWLDTAGVFTPGVLPADAGPCETGCVDTICVQRCDDTDGDGAADATYSELWCVHADGTAELVLTYQSDPSTPYAPVSPVECAYGCPESETVTLCDDSGPFLRRYTFLNGTASHEDVALDGQTPHLVTGTVRVCATTAECEEPTTPTATVGLCLADGTPIAVVVTRDCDGTVSQDGWLNLTTGAYSAGDPPAGTMACGDSRSITVAGTFCDVDPVTGDVHGLVLVEYSYGPDGSVESVRLVDAVTGDTYTPLGEVTTCPAGVEQPERDLLQLCDVIDDESGALLPIPFVRDYQRSETGQITGHTDYTLDGQPYTPSGTVGVCQAQPEEPCASTVTVLRLCDLNPDVAPDEDGKRCAVPFLRHLVYDCTGALVETRDTTTDGTTPYTPVEAVDCGSGVPAMVEVPWEVVDIQPDPDSEAGRGLIYTLSPIDDPETVGRVTVTTTATANTACPGTPPSYNFRNPCTYTFSPDQALQDAATYVRCDLLDFDTFEPVTALTPPPSRLGGTAYWDGTTVRPTESNGVGEMYYDGPPASWSYRVGNTGGGNSCSSLSFAAVSLRAEGCCAPCGSSGGGDGSGRTVQEVCVIANSAPTEVMTWTRVIEDGGATIYYLDQEGTRYDNTLPAGHQIVACPVEPEPCRDSATVLLCDVSALDTVTVLDTVNRQDADGWEITSFTDGGCVGYQPPDGPVPGPAIWSAPGYLGVRADRSLGATSCSGAWEGYDAAPIRWVLTKTFVAPQDGTAVITADQFRADGGGRVRVNGTDVGLYGQWNQPAVGGSSQVPVTAGPNVIEIEVRDISGPNWLRGRLDIVMTRTTQFLRKQVTDCETGAVISVTDTTLDGEPYEVTGEVGQCQTVSQCCEQATPELRVDVESDVMCIRDAGGEITGQVVVERVYDDQSGDRVVQRLTDPTTGDEVTLPDGAELVLCQEPPCPTAFSTECVGIVERSEASYDNTSLIGGVPGQCGGVQGPGGQFPCQPTTGGLTITSWIVNGEEVIGDGGRSFAGGPCGEGTPGNLGMHHNWALALTNLDPSGATWSAQNQPGCAWFVGSTGGTQTVYGPMVVEDVDGREWTLTPAQSCQETQFTKVYSQGCDGTVSVSWLDADGVATDAPEGQQVPCGTGCSAGGGRGLDVEPVVLCDTPEDGPSVPFLRHFSYGSAGQVAGVIDTALDGATPYVPTGTVGRCQPDPAEGRDVELVSMCVVDNTTGSVLARILAEVTYDTATGERLSVDYVDPLTWGPVPVPGGASITTCPDPEPGPDVELLALCDVTEDGTTPFLRHLTYAEGSTVPAVADTELDAVTPYTPSGTVSSCTPEPEECHDVSTVLLCDVDTAPPGGGGTPTVTDSSTPHRTGSVPGIARLPGGGQALWDGGTLIFPADPDGSAGDGGQVNRWVNATITAPAPACDDGTGTATVTISVDVTPDDWACGGFGFFGLYGPDGAIATTGPGLGDRGPSGAGRTIHRTVSGVVRSADLAAGRIVAWLNLRTYINNVTTQSNGQGGTCTSAANGPLRWVAENFTVDVEQHAAADCATQFLRTIRRDCETGETVSVIDQTLDGQPYEVTGEVGQCQTAGGGECCPTSDTVTLCDVAEDGTTTPFLRRLVYTPGVATPSVEDTTLDGAAYEPTGMVSVCPSEAGPAPEPCGTVSVVELCDVAADGTRTRFLRHITRDCQGDVTGTTDTELDAVTLYTVTGEIGNCECPAQVLEQCRCDDTDGDGVGDTDYVELVSVDCTGALTSLGTYIPDLSGPYTPVSPAECPVEGAPPARGVQAHRVELAPGQTWDLSSQPLVQSVTVTAHGGTGQITTVDGGSTLHAGEAVTWSVQREDDAMLDGPLAITAQTGTVTVAYTRITVS